MFVSVGMLVDMFGHSDAHTWMFRCSDTKMLGHPNGQTLRSELILLEKNNNDDDDGPSVHR